ncbi:MAG: UbiA family prenyltransferase [Saprospirales bacterium]|nr:UbiA family prenyltransferase [Saprospirales bacterium]MBK6904362.1 UbiA family prenyltransferase [Saprospirales bacterium]MBK7336494.1 UbiA family prenyltransferase [Saprospirales bacterium]
MKKYLSLIAFSHTLFALPFAMVGFFLGHLHRPESEFPFRELVLVLLCMVFARSAAMAFNRYADRHIDRKNPRTASREIPSGAITPKSALGFVIASSLSFILCTWLINPICFYLSPVALLVVLGYSYTKRFTPLCHLILGLGLALAPIGAYLAVAGVFHLVPILFGGAVLCWVSGFDIIYALQDDEFDKTHRLFSIPVALGRRGALGLSIALHLVCAGFITSAVFMVSQTLPEIFGWITWVATGFFLSMLIYQHLIVSPNNLSRVNRAFFTTNGFASLIFGALFILDVYI